MMMATIRTASLLAAASAALAITAPAALAKDVGIAAAVVKEVKLKPAADKQPHAARVREPVGLADQVSTGAASRLQILLLDKSTFTVGANARLTIDRFVFDPDQKSNFTATVAKGAFRFMSGSKGHGTSSSIKTPVASIGIRGTIVDGIVGPEAITITRLSRNAGPVPDADPETATLVVLRGPGRNTAGNVTPGAISVEAGGKTVETDRPMMAVFVPRAGAQPIGPFAISMPGLRQLDVLILPRTDAAMSEGSPSNYGAPPPRVRPPIFRGNPYGAPDGQDTQRGPTMPGVNLPNLIDFGGRQPDRPTQPRDPVQPVDPARSGQSAPPVDQAPPTDQAPPADQAQPAYRAPPNQPAGTDSTPPPGNNSPGARPPGNNSPPPPSNGKP